MVLFADHQVEISAELSLFVRENMHVLTSKCKEQLIVSYSRELSSPVLHQLPILWPVQPFVKHNIDTKNTRINKML
jgi:hypothetical protein